jgi:hypothetical protein
VSGLSVWRTGQEKLKEAVAENEILAVDDADKWSMRLLGKLLGQKLDLDYLGAVLVETSDLINSLCIK